MNTNQAKLLLNRYLKGTCTAQEKELVDRWYAELESTGETTLNEEDKQELGARMAAWLEEQMADQNKVVSISHSPNRTILRWVAAAAVLIIGSVSAFWFLGNRQTEIGQPVTIVNPATILAPGNVKATVTLSNGTVVLLDSIGAVALAEPLGVKLVHTANGELVYEAGNSLKEGPSIFNTLNNPRGSRVATLVLADGTRVWLNAGSSVTYPIAFTRNERKVSITGEAYFEVTKDSKRPFTVSSGLTNVEVLGTHFNMNTYGDDDVARVTLLEGSVKVENEAGEALLKPGQQAVVNDLIAVNSQVDIEKIMAWKNGIFHFENADINLIMQEIGRWYDMDIKILDKGSKRRFGGEISRNSSLGQVLMILQESKVQFTVEGKSIVVKSAQ